MNKHGVCVVNDFVRVVNDFVCVVNDSINEKPSQLWRLRSIKTPSLQHTGFCIVASVLLFIFYIYILYCVVRFYIYFGNRY